jgi:hypothetical protein
MFCFFVVCVSADVSMQGQDVLWVPADRVRLKFKREVVGVFFLLKIEIFACRNIDRLGDIR